MSKTGFVDACQGLAFATYKGLQATDRTLMHGRIGHLLEAHMVKIILVLGALVGLLHHLFRDSLSRAGVSCLVLAGVVSLLNVFFLNNSAEFQKNERVFLSRAKKLTLLFLCSFLFLFCIFCTAGGFFGFSALHVRQVQPAVKDFVRQPAPLNSASIVAKSDEDDANQNLVYVESPKPAVKSAAEKLRDKVKAAEKEATPEPVEEVARAFIDSPADAEPEKAPENEKPAMAGATITATQDVDSNPELNAIASVQAGGETFVSVTNLPAGAHSPAAAAAIESSKYTASISADSSADGEDTTTTETKQAPKEEKAVAEINGGAPAGTDHSASKEEKAVASIATSESSTKEASQDFKLNGGILGGAKGDAAPPTEAEIAIAAIQGGSESENTPSSAAAAIEGDPVVAAPSKKKPAPTHVEVETETDPAIAHPSRPTPAASSSVLPAAATREVRQDPLEHAVPDRTLALADDEDSKNDLAEFERQRKELVNQLKQKLTKSRIGKQQKEQIRSQSNWHSNAVPTDSAVAVPVASAATPAAPEDHSQMLEAAQAHLDVDARLRAALEKTAPAETDENVHARQHSHKPRQFQPPHSTSVRVADANVADAPAEEASNAVPVRTHSRQAPTQHNKKQQQKKQQPQATHHARPQPHHQQAHQTKARKHSKVASTSTSHVESQAKRARKQAPASSKQLPSKKTKRQRKNL